LNYIKFFKTNLLFLVVGLRMNPE